MSRSASRVAAAGVRKVNFATSPLLASPTPPWRSRIVVLCVALGFLALLGRAVYVQLVATDFYQAQGEKRFVHRQTLPASRGRILDRHGQVLATSVAMPSVQVETRAFAADRAQRRQLAQLLGLKAAELDERLEGATGTVTLRRHVDEDTWQRVKALGLKGVQEVREYQRRYPEGEAAAHVVGFTNIDGQGLEGIELGFQEALQGRRGQRTMVRDRLGRPVEDIGDQADPVHGRDVVLALDSKVQFFAWQRLRDTVRAHGARAGSAVVLDARTGEVLALANYPSYDPANRRNLGGAQLRNRALTDIFEPGSTMKPFVAALALETGRVRASTPVQTAPGRITVTGSTISASGTSPYFNILRPRRPMLSAASETRSKSLAIFMLAITSRRSLATGLKRIRISIPSRSMVRSSELTSSSAAMASLHCSRFRLRRPWMALARFCEARLAMVMTWWRNPLSAASKLPSVWGE